MLESLVLAVEVGHEVFRGFRQVENGLEVDDFGRHAGDRGKIARQEPQIAHICHDVGG